MNILGGKNSDENKLIGSKTKLKDLIWMRIPKINKRTVPNKSVRVGEILEINKGTPYVYLEPQSKGIPLQTHFGFLVNTVLTEQNSPNFSNCYHASSNKD